MLSFNNLGSGDAGSDWRHWPPWPHWPTYTGPHDMLYAVLKREMAATIKFLAPLEGLWTVDTIPTMNRKAPIRKPPVKRIGLISVEFYILAKWKCRRRA